MDSLMKAALVACSSPGNKNNLSAGHGEIGPAHWVYFPFTVFLCIGNSLEDGSVLVSKPQCCVCVDSLTCQLIGMNNFFSHSL